MDHVRFDVTPETLFKPRFVSGPERKHLIQETQGFMFYVDYMDGAASLMVMKTYNLTSKTVGEVLDVPQDLLHGAATREGVRDICCMYPIDEALEVWIKKELGLSP
jgi:hypothetical protein